MIQIIRTIGVFAAVALSAASASAPSKHKVNSTVEISASYNATWSALIDLFAERSWAILNIDKASGLITTDWMNLPDADGNNYADCGEAPLATKVATMVRFNVRVKEGSSSSEVSVNPSFRQLRGSGAFYPCTSTGGVEVVIHHEVDRRTQRTETKQQNEDRLIFYCTESPVDATVAACAHSEAGCLKRQSDIVALSGDATPCVQQHGAACFRSKTADGSISESCHPALTACEAQRNKIFSEAPGVTVEACASR